MNKRATRWGAAAAAVLLSTSAIAGSRDAAPHSGLSPAEVVRCQMDALRSNGVDDEGIATAFRFASPANKRATGPLPRFVHMIKHSPYRVMLHPRLVEYGAPLVEDDRAELRVSLLTQNYLAVAFRFYLSKQSHPECEGCWMTDAVTVEDARPLPGVQT